MAESPRSVSLGQEVTDVKRQRASSLAPRDKLLHREAARALLRELTQASWTTDRFYAWARRWQDRDHLHPVLIGRRTYYPEWELRRLVVIQGGGGDDGGPSGDPRTDFIDLEDALLVARNLGVDVRDVMRALMSELTRAEAIRYLRAASAMKNRADFGGPEPGAPPKATKPSRFDPDPERKAAA